MPWSHCDVAFILDDEVCPKCGSNKDSWTVQIEKTRQLVIGRRKKTKASIDIELRTPQGEPDAGREYRATFANGRVKSGKLDEQGRAHFKQLYPGPVEVEFPEVELDQARPSQPPRRGQRQVLAAPLAEAVKANPQPLAGWELQTLAASAAKPTPTLAAAQLLTALPLAPPPAAEPADSEPAEEGDPLKAELPLQLTFASRRDAQAWLLRNPIQVHVDGERVAAGSYLRDARTVVVQFRLPPGEHHVLVSSRQGDLRTIYVSRQLELTGPAAEAEGDDEPALGRADLAKGPAEQGRGGAPSKELDRDLGQGPSRDLGRRDSGPGKGLSQESLASPASRGPSRELAAGSGKQLGAPKAGRANLGGASTNPLANLVHSEWSGDPIGLTREQIQRGAGELYVFQPPADTLKAELPLEVTFASRREAQGWLLRNRLQVYVDGQPVAHGAHVADPKRILVQFRVEPGDHHVIVSAQSQGLSTMLVSRQLTISDGSGSGAVKPAPPCEAPAKRPGRAPRGRATQASLPGGPAKLGSSATALRTTPAAPKAAVRQAVPRAAAPKAVPKAAAPKAVPKTPKKRFPR